MSSTTRTRTTRTTAATGTARTLRSVPDQPTDATIRTDAEDKLWASLRTHPNSTAADLSVAAKIGKSTAQKILVKWAGDGSVIRTPGIAAGGRRAADLWAIAENEPALAPNTAGDDGDTTTDGMLADEHPADATLPTDTMRDVPTTTPADPLGIADGTLAEENPAEEPTTQPATVPRPDHAHDAATDKATEPANSTHLCAKERDSGDGSTPDDATQTALGDGKDGTSERLAPGTLRGMVEDFLREHPGKEFGPVAVAKQLGGKSSGAVSNALDKLASAGTAVQTNTRPRRFALAPSEAAETPATTR